MAKAKISRLSISLPTDLGNKLINNFKPKERSKLVADALDWYFNRDLSKSVLQEMIEGYIKTRQEDLTIANESPIS